MRHLRKYLHRVGLLSTLLISGILGGLMAPLSSDAAPTLTLQIDNQQPVSFLSATNLSSTCTSAEVTLGYTACYAIRTGTTPVGDPTSASCPTCRQYTIQNAPGATARLRVADKLGQDKFSLIGVQFVPALAAGQTVVNWNSAQTPTANTDESHTLTITMQNLFNSSVNVANAGLYVWALRTGGEFRTGGGTACSPSPCTAVRDRVEFTGRGTFNASLGTTNILSPGATNTPPSPNSLPLSFTVAGPPLAPILSYAGLTNTTMGQVDPSYPKFDCRTTISPSNCTPDITLTMKVTLYGPDTFVVVNGNDGDGAPCVLSAQESNDLTRKITFLKSIVTFLDRWEVRHHNAKLRTFIDQMLLFLATWSTSLNSDCPGTTLVKIAQAVEAATDQVAFTADLAVPAEPAPAGTITISKHVDLFCEGSCSSVPFTFSIRNTSDNSILTETTVTTDGTGNGSSVVSVPDGQYNVIELPQPGWTLTHSSCNERNTNGVDVSAGNNVTCSFTNSPATGNDLGIRLTWGALPTDLDSHLYIPNGNEVAYFSHGSLVASPYAELDLDDVTSFGPEVITVVRRMKGTYQYFVHDYSDRLDTVITNPMTSSPTKVELITNGTTTTYVPPASEGTNRYWHVFNVVVNSDCGSTTIVPVNVWSTSPPVRLTTTTTEDLCP